MGCSEPATQVAASLPGSGAARRTTKPLPFASATQTPRRASTPATYTSPRGPTATLASCGQARRRLIGRGDGQLRPRSELVLITVVSDCEPRRRDQTTWTRPSGPAASAGLSSHVSPRVGATTRRTVHGVRGPALLATTR